MQYILKLRLKHEGTDLKSLDQKGKYKIQFSAHLNRVMTSGVDAS